MLSLPKKTFHALEAVLYIALGGAASPVSSKEIAERQGVPPRYLEQLMQKLVRAKILRGVRGPRGGYLLARERRRITLADICAVLEEKEAKAPATALAKEVVEPAWEKAASSMQQALSMATLADLCAEASAKHLAGRAEEKTDFSI